MAEINKKKKTWTALKQIPLCISKYQDREKKKEKETPSESNHSPRKAVIRRLRPRTDYRPARRRPRCYEWRVGAPLPRCTVSVATCCLTQPTPVIGPRVLVIAPREGAPKLPDRALGAELSRRSWRWGRVARAQRSVVNTVLPAHQGAKDALGPRPVPLSTGVDGG